MILFCDSNGTIQKNLGSPVYQGSANSNIIYLIAPYAPSASVLAAFQLPDGTAIAPVAMTPQSSVPGVQNADGTTFAGWSYVLPGSVTAKYGTVSAQFFFYAPTGESSNPTSIIATASTSFQVGRGVTAILPDTPDADVYESILSNIAQLQTDLTGGYYAARAIYAWNSSYTYGSNEITFYPVGNYGAFVKSLVNRNTQQPYTSAGVLNSNWAEVTNFNTIAEDFYTEIQTAVQQAQTAQAGAEAAQTAAESAQTASEAAKESAALSAANAQNYLSDVHEARDQVSNYRDEVETAVTYIRNMGLEIAEDVTHAENSASAAASSASAAAQSAGQSAQSALQAQEYAQQAHEYAQKHYEIVASYDALPQPGNSAYIYLVPSSTASGADNYEEYLWITNTSSYEFIGTTSDVDLSNYAQVNGTYSGMTVGAVLATQLTNQDIHDFQGPEYWGKTYFGAGGNAVQNKPEGVDGFYLEVLRGGTSSTIHRLIAAADTSGESVSPNIYIEQYVTSWSSWEEVATSDGTYPQMTVGAADKLSKRIICSNGSGINGYFKICTFTSPKTSVSNSFIFLINGIYGDQPSSYAAESGLIEFDIRSNNNGVVISQCGLSILSGNLKATDFFMVPSDDLASIDFYIYLQHQYGSAQIVELSASDYTRDIEFDGTRYTSAPSGAVYAITRNDASSLGSIPAANYAQIDGSYAGLGAGHLQEIQINTRSSDTVGWYKCGEFDVSRNTGAGDLSCSVILQINGTNYGNYSESAINVAPSGQIEVDTRIVGGVYSLAHSAVLVISGYITSNDFCIDTSDNGEKLNLYVNISHRYRDFKITKISEGQENVSSPNIFEFTDEYYGTSAPSGAVYAVVRNNASYADQAGNAATATDSEKLGGVLATNYAINTGTYTGMTVGKAVNDSEGNNIVETYLTKVAAGTAAPLYEHTFYYQGETGMTLTSGYIALYVSCLSPVDHAPRTDTTQHTFEDILNILCGTIDPGELANIRVTANGFISGNDLGSNINTNIFYMTLDPSGPSDDIHYIDVILGTTSSATEAFSNNLFFKLSTRSEYVEVSGFVKNWKVKAV